MAGLLFLTTHLGIWGLALEIADLRTEISGEDIIPQASTCPQIVEK